MAALEIARAFLIDERVWFPPALLALSTPAHETQRLLRASGRGPRPHVRRLIRLICKFVIDIRLASLPKVTAASVLVWTYYHFNLSACVMSELFFLNYWGSERFWFGKGRRGEIRWMPGRA